MNQQTLAKLSDDGGTKNVASANNNIMSKV
jgi:hypothetical protein